MVTTALPTVAVIVLNWNGGEDTVECLESLLNSAYPTFRVYVVDNGSTDNSLDVIRRYARGDFHVRSTLFEYNSGDRLPPFVEFPVETPPDLVGKASAVIAGLRIPSVVLLCSSANLGFAQGNNAGLRFVQSVESPDYALILNNDTVVDPGALAELVRIGETDSRIGAVGARILYYDKGGRKDIVQFAGGSIDFGRFPGYFALGKSSQIAGGQDGCVECQWVSGTAMLIRMRSIPHPILDPSFFFGCEDVDFCLRLSSRGLRVVLAPNAVVWHKAGVSRRKRHSGRKLWQWLDDVKTDLLFLRKHGPRGWGRVPRYTIQAIADRMVAAAQSLRRSHRRF